MKYLFALAFVMSSACALAQKTPEKIAIGASAKEGAILFRVPVMPFDYALQFSKDGRDGFLSRAYVMKVKAGGPGYRYIARTLKPGGYQLNSIWQQGAWGACLAADTVSINVKPGTILWVGTLETAAILNGLQGKAVEAGRTSVHPTSVNLFFNGIPVPILSGRDESGLNEARLFARQGMVKASAPVELANVESTKFETGGVNQSIGICG